MTRWLVKADISQSILDDFNPEPQIKNEEVEQGDLFDNWYTKTYTTPVEDPQKQYNIKIYNTEYFGFLLTGKHLTKPEIVDLMNFYTVTAQKSVNLSANKFEALKQLKRFTEDNTKPFDVVKLELDNDVYFFVNCTEGTGLGMEICRDELSAAGKLNQYLYRLNN